MVTCWIESKLVDLDAPVVFTWTITQTVITGLNPAFKNVPMANKSTFFSSLISAVALHFRFWNIILSVLDEFRPIPECNPRTLSCF